MSPLSKRTQRGLAEAILHPLILGGADGGPPHPREVVGGGGLRDRMETVHDGSHAVNERRAS